jgi:DNA-binding response OmpR family regulator
MNAAETVLVVEDDDRIRRALKLALADEGYEVLDVATGEEAIERARERTVSAVLVDLNLPGINGFEVCRRIRLLSPAPIIIVSAREDSHDVVAGLEAGADDYVTKPFVFKELAARLRANLRRHQPESARAGPVDFGGLRIAADEGRIWLDGEEVGLTATEFRLLCAFADQPGRVLSREQVLATVWGYDYYGDVRLVDAHIRRLRTKIEPDPSSPARIVTVRGLGYRFEPEPHE